MDGMPPLVDRGWEYLTPRPDGVPGAWPAAPPAWPGAAVGGVEQPAQPTGWGLPPAAFAAAVPVQPVPVFPPFLTPAVTNVPVPANDEWVRHITPTPAPQFHSMSRPSTPYADSPRSDASHISRSRSFTGSIHERHKRPPREWRPHFSMIKPSALEAIGSLFRSKSVSGIDPSTVPKVALSPYLRHTSSYSPMTLDVRQNPETIRFTGMTGPADLYWDLIRYACEPPLPVMTLVSPHFPWFIEVTSGNPTGITLRDLFWAIWANMMTQISAADYWNTEMNETAREGVAEAFNVRCGSNIAERGVGIRRVDYLMGRVMLKGLVRLRDGTFEMKFKLPDP